MSNDNIEIQIFDNEIFDSLKKYASYSSEITRVCSFRPELKQMLISYGLEIKENNFESSNNKPLLTVQGSNIMKLENASSSMLYYVGCRSEFDPTISLKNTNEVCKLIENNLIDKSQDFNELYSKMNYRSKIKDLICASVKFYGKGRLTDYVDSEATIQSLLSPNNIKTKTIKYKQAKCKILEDLDDKSETKEKYWECKVQEEKTNQKFILRFYYKAPILKSFLFKDNIISFSTSKLLEENDYIICYDPIITPNDLLLISDEFVSPPNRKIPADLWRNAYYEFKIRYNQE